MKWLKYRFKFSYEDGEWKYEPIYLKNFDRSYAEQIIENKVWELGYDDEHYRGFDLKVLNSGSIPKNIIENEYNSIKNQIKNLKNRLKMIEEKLK